MAPTEVRFPDMTLTARLRRLWLNVHLWIGVGLLVVLAPLAVTGSILVWHDPIDHALYAERYATTGGPVARPASAYAQAAQAAFGARAQVMQLRFPQRAGDPVVAVGRMPGPPGSGARPRSLNAWLNPADARVLAVAEVNAQATMVLHRVHGTLLIPGIGRKVVGWLGWAMFVSSATGLWLWWPRRGGFLKGLRWTRGEGALFNLHHQVGFWVCLPLAVLSLTGVYISFPQTSHALFGAPPPPQRSGAARNAPPITPQMSLDAAVAVAGRGVLREVNWPVRGAQPAWRIGLDGGRQVRVVDATGEARADAARDGARRAPDPTSKLMRQVHDGTDMGLAWRIVITLAGLAPPVLGVTGIVMWLRRRGRGAT